MAFKKIIPGKIDLKRILPDKIDLTSFSSDFIKLMKSKSEELGTYNTLIVGKTGVGKSSLINAIFRDNLAETGIGAPVTDRIRMITKKGVPIRIYDTVGLELDAEQQKKVMNEINKLINENRALGERESIHCIWYCINTAASKLEPVEEEFINQLAATGVPVVIVLTKAFSVSEAKALRKYIEGRNLNAKGICAVLAHRYSDSRIQVKAYGLKELVSITRLVISQSAEEVFLSMQKVDMEAKRKKANFYISTAVSLAAAQCVNPIPMSDAPVLTTIQMSMLASITLVYGVSMDKNDIAQVLAILLSTQGVKVAGITLAGFLKSVVGIGTAAGGFINIVVATTLTATLGKTYACIMEEVALNKLDIKNMDKKKWGAEVRRILKNMKKDGSVFEFDGVE